MLKKKSKFISSFPLTATILLASLTPALAQAANVKIGDSQSINQQPSTSEARNNQACITTKVQEYVSKLGTPGLTNTDFEALVRCDFQAVPVLSQALKSDRAEVRASAAYALGQIGQESYVAVPDLVMILRDDSSSDVRAIAAYTLGRIGSKAEAAVPRLIAIFNNPNEDSAVHDQSAQALKEISSKEVNSDLNEPRNASLSAEASTTIHKSQSSSLSEYILAESKRGEFRGKADIERMIQNTVHIRTLSASPIICSLPGIRNIFPRCK